MYILSDLQTGRQTGSYLLTSSTHSMHNQIDGKPKPTLADQVRRHGPVFVVWWGTLWAAGAAGLFAVRLRGDDFVCVCVCCFFFFFK